MLKESFDFSFLVGSEVPVRRFKAGETIFREGDPATEVYVIQSGRVEIQLGNRLLDTIEANEIFGEMALIDDKPRSATAIAVTDVALVPISQLQFLLLVSRKPAFALEVMRVLALRLRAANKPTPHDDIAKRDRELEKWREEHKAQLEQ
jgi:CRP/FNR family cyclic AMP-dependent transcriptional regulator